MLISKACLRRRIKTLLITVAKRLHFARLNASELLRCYPLYAIMTDFYRNDGNVFSVFRLNTMVNTALNIKSLNTELN